jgi:hypothetical protein
VFDHVKVLANHPGPKVFIEEDNYFAPDMLHVVHMLTAALGETATESGLFSLGPYGVHPPPPPPFPLLLATAQPSNGLVHRATFLRTVFCARGMLLDPPCLVLA